MRYFQAAAQSGSYSKAAEFVHITQPSLTIAIRKLEAELGVSLFVPKMRRAVLTEAGRVFLQDVESVFSRVEMTESHMAQFSERDRAELRLAYTAAVADGLIPKILKQFLGEEYRHCCINTDEMPTDRIAAGIREGRFELGIGSELPADPELEMTPFRYERFCLLLSEGATESFDSPETLQNTEMVGYRKDYPMYRNLDQLFRRLNVAPHITQYTYSERAIALFVENGFGVGIVPETEGLSECHVQIRHPQWLDGEGRWLYFFKHRTRPLPQLAAGLEAWIRQEYLSEDEGGES